MNDPNNPRNPRHTTPWSTHPIPPPAAPRPPTNVAAIIALTCGMLALLVLPILLGPAAIIAGFVGEHQARKEDRRLGKAALAGLVLGMLTTLIALERAGLL